MGATARTPAAAGTGGTVGEPLQPVRGGGRAGPRGPRRGADHRVPGGGRTDAEKPRSDRASRRKVRAPWLRRRRLLAAERPDQLRLFARGGGVAGAGLGASAQRMAPV